MVRIQLSRNLYRNLSLVVKAKYYTKPKENRKTSGQAWLLLAGVTTTFTAAALYALGRPEESIEGLAVEGHVKYSDENIIKAYIFRAWDKVVELKNTFSEPSSAKLLPDLLPPPYQRPYTLIIELNDLLIHTEYDRTVGWKYQKRPGVDALLVSLFDFYEIVVFTTEVPMTGNSIITALDPNQLIMYRLFRDATKYIDGEHIKDLSGLNRSLNRVIVVDTKKEAVKFHPENAIILKKWNGDISDRTLWDLIPFLQTIAVNNVEDTRPVLDYYKQKGGEEYILETFKTHQERLKAEEEDFNRQKATERHRVGSTLGRISPFSFQKNRILNSQQNQMKQSSELEPTTNLEESINTGASLSSKQHSWTEWIGSWIGWK